MIRWNLFDIRVVMKSLTGKATDIYINRDELVIDLKKKYSKVDGIPVDQLRLIYQRKALDNDDSTIAATGIENNSVVFTVIRLRGPPRLVTIRPRRRSERLEQKREKLFLLRVKAERDAKEAERVAQSLLPVPVRTGDIQCALEHFLHGTRKRVDGGHQKEEKRTLSHLQWLEVTRWSSSRSRSRSRSRSPS
jgi:hypothetical protein